MTKKIMNLSLVTVCVLVFVLIVVLVYFRPRGEERELDLDGNREPDRVQQAERMQDVNIEVESDGRTVTALDRDGKAKWSVDVIAECGVPDVGEPVIRDIKIEGTQVRVVFGKHSFASIDIETGQVTFLGSD